jgi:TrmH family RNA methyltransferase
LVKLLRSLRRGDPDPAERRLLLEGPHLVEEALRSHLELLAVAVSPRVLERPEVIDLLRRLPPEKVEIIEDELLDSIADSDSPRGLVAIARGPRPHFGVAAAGSRIVLTDRIQDPGNLGAVARVAEATGVGRLIALQGSSRTTHPRALRASAGSLLRVPVQESDVETARADTAALSWIALDPHRGSDLYQTEVPAGAVLCLGAEGPGLSPEVASRVDAWLRIPMAGRVESLNVAVAAGVVLFELERRSRLA